MTDDWMQERTQAPLDKMKDFVATLGAPLVSAVQDRLGVIQAGKRMLDEGGEAAELEVLAKKVALDAVASDNDIMDRMQNAVDMYSDAATLLRKSGLRALDHLASSYTERSDFYSKILENAGKAPKEPPMTDTEWDAIKFIQLRQAKAQLGLRQQVGGSKAGRHGNSLFNCMDRDRAPGNNVSDDSDELRHCPENEHPMPSFSTPSVVDWSISVGDNQSSQHASNMQRVGWSFDEASGGALAADSINSGMRPVGGTMASKVEAMGKPLHESAPPQNSQTVPRTDTLDTLNTCLESLDALKKNIDTIDAPLPPHRATTESHECPFATSQNSETFSNGSSQARGSMGAHGYVSKDAAKQAASRQILQETRRSTPPRSQRQTPSDNTNDPSQGSFSYPVITNTTSYAVGTTDMNAPSQGSFSHPVITPSQGSFSVKESYPVITPSQGSFSVKESFPASSAPLSTPVGVCPYKVGDMVEIFSKSVNAWVNGSVVSVEGWVLTVQYANRERKVDLKDQRVFDFFRSPEQRPTNCIERPTVISAPAFDSMLTNVDVANMAVKDPIPSPGCSPRLVKTAVL